MARNLSDVARRREPRRQSMRYALTGHQAIGGACEMLECKNTAGVITYRLTGCGSQSSDPTEIPFGSAWRQRLAPI